MLDLTLLFRRSSKRRQHYHFTQEEPHLPASFLFQCTKLEECQTPMRNDTNTLELRFQNYQIRETRYSDLLRILCFSQVKELTQFPPQLVIYVLCPLKGQPKAQSLCSWDLQLELANILDSPGENKIKVMYCHVIREGNGTPLQYSCLENPVDGGAWQAAVHGVARSQTRLSNITFTLCKCFNRIGIIISVNLQKSPLKTPWPEKTGVSGKFSIRNSVY